MSAAAGERVRLEAGWKARLLDVLTGAPMQALRDFLRAELAAGKTIYPPPAQIFAALDATVIGVSRDTVKKHDRFKAKYDLAVILASDEDGAACEAWGVWVQKKLYGREYMGIERATFLIDAEGRIARVWRNVKVADHAAAVLEAVRSL